MKIAVIGAGAWGTAIAMLLARNNHIVTLYTRHLDHAQEINQLHTNKKYLHDIILPDIIRATTDFSDIVDQKVIIIVTPSDQVRATIENLKQHRISNSTIIGIASKGFDHNHAKLLSNVVKDYLVDNPLFIVAGPNLASEVAQGLPCALTIAAIKKEVQLKGAALFHSTNVITSTTEDIITIQVASAFKNIIAIITGIIIAKQYGQNCKASVITQGIKEIYAFAKAAGSPNPDISEFAVIGDLILTSYALTSRNTQFGYELGQQEYYSDLNSNTNENLVEGIKAAKILYPLTIRLNLSCHVIECAYSILYDRSKISSAIELMLKKINTETK
ncbi:NAD-dependent glycerol-3-phosphate dehydrogenase family protein [Orientia chuto str. Dubai]|uniref:Glycerol-3-phosphate dehydrogenase [NAD(P)+] n=1 Tax=Orientia chuto str. Dubai TaxID=1359168 RepID=A0A0F3MLM9_9RICK|nr:NAD(P)H-dependent glycerol-3-phosphate dehydrogenase [Candidatus Orientia mediorientalis]KJV55519.1 NAD-dependent glycerol-3-phosphate dehydrogenase family protein [Orientia chuto str. Dubai]